MRILVIGASKGTGALAVRAALGRGHKVTALDPARGVLSAKEELELSTGKVGTEPPSLEALSKVAEGAFLPNLTSMKEVKEADVAFLALHGGQGEDGTIYPLSTVFDYRSPEEATIAGRSGHCGIEGLQSCEGHPWRKAVRRSLRMKLLDLAKEARLVRF